MLTSNDASTVVYQIRRYLKLAMLLIATALSAYYGLADIIVAVRESAPTQLSVDHWEAYAGQHWLSVDGQLAVERAVIMPTGDQHDHENDYVTAFVPIVSSPDNSSDPIHAVAVVGPISRSIVADFLRQSGGDATVTGVIGSYNNSRIFPRDNLDPNVVFINANSKPPTGLSSWLLPAFAFWVTLVCLYIVYRDIKKWRSWRRDAAILSKIRI